MSEKREAPLSRVWNRAKAKAPRQKVIASTIATVRRAKPGNEAKARELLIADAAKQGVTDLSDKELRVMVDAVTTSAKDAASQAVTKGVSGVKSLWSSLQTSTPSWVELPDDVAALNLRSDQSPVEVPIEVDDAELLRRLADELPPDSSGARTFDCWLALDGALTRVHVGRSTLGRIPAPADETVAHVVARRRAWTPAVLREGVVSVQLPDRP